MPDAKGSHFQNSHRRDQQAALTGQPIQTFNIEKFLRGQLALSAAFNVDRQQSEFIRAASRLSGGESDGFSVRRECIVADSERTRARNELSFVFSVQRVGNPQRTVFVVAIVAADKRDFRAIRRDAYPALSFIDDFLRNAAENRNAVNADLCIEPSRSAGKIQKISFGRNRQPIISIV